MPKIITISRNKITRDRSYVHALFCVVSENETHMRVKQLGRNVPSYWAGIHTISKDEHTFCDATKMATPDELRQALLFQMI